MRAAPAKVWSLASGKKLLDFEPVTKDTCTSISFHGTTTVLLALCDLGRVTRGSEPAPSALHVGSMRAMFLRESRYAALAYKNKIANI